MGLTFAQTYERITREFITNPHHVVNFSCRNLAMGREMPATLIFDMDPRGVSIFSEERHRVVPIKFVLAELCWILAGQGDVKSIASYNKSMAHYSNDGVTVGGSYGLRLVNQLPKLVQRLKEDPYTRQAVAIIFREDDCLDETKTHMPCNVFLQFLCRPPLLDLHVTSRSSDFVTGFSIDSLHWQALLILMANELKAVGITVVPNLVHYNIASLHVYKDDCPMVDAWATTRLNVPRVYEHVLPLVGNMTLTEAIERCKQYFKPDLSLMELMDVLNMGTEHLTHMISLDVMFRHFKNKVVR